LRRPLLPARAHECCLFYQVLTAPGINDVLLPDTAGEVFIDTLGYDTRTSTRNIGILIAFYYGFCALAGGAFYLRTQIGQLRLSRS
jgi:hypothetical protein